MTRRAADKINKQDCYPLPRSLRAKGYTQSSSISVTLIFVSTVMRSVSLWNSNRRIWQENVCGRKRTVIFKHLTGEMSWSLDVSDDARLYKFCITDRLRVRTNVTRMPRCSNSCLLSASHARGQRDINKTSQRHLILERNAFGHLSNQTRATRRRVPCKWRWMCRNRLMIICTLEN